jgi:hypothetical protein
MPAPGTMLYTEAFLSELKEPLTFCAGCARNVSARHVVSVAAPPLSNRKFPDFPAYHKSDHNSRWLVFGTQIGFIAQPCLSDAIA